MYDDEAIKELLDRRNIDETPMEDAIEHAPLQEYLSSFKVATYKEVLFARMSL